MQRPFAARRVRAGAVDRQVAIGSFVLTAVGLLSAVALARASLPENFVRDAAAARDLVALMRTGEQGRWIARYDFTRTLANGQVRRQGVSEGRDSSFHVVIAGTAMTMERGDRHYECNLVGDVSGCKPVKTVAGLAPSEVLRVAVATGAYSVIRRPATTIADVRARCFRVRATGHGSLPDLGVETERCFSNDGIPLRLVVIRPPGNVDAQTATSVQRRATTRSVRTLAESFGRNPPSDQH